MSCAGCETRDRTIADLTEELAAWRGAAADDTAAAAAVDRLDRWRTALGLPAVQALTLMALVDHADQVVSRRRVVAATRRADRRCKEADEVEDKLADVYMCKLRALLKPFAVGHIHGVWGHGWRVDRALADRVRVLVGEVAS